MLEDNTAQVLDLTKKAKMEADKSGALEGAFSFKVFFVVVGVQRFALLYACVLFPSGAEQVPSCAAQVRLHESPALPFRIFSGGLLHLDYSKKSV